MASSALGLKQRLPSGRIREVLASGERSIGDRVVAFVAPGDGGVAFVVGRRVGGAVERNRARRVMRAAWKDVAARAQEDFDIVFVARKTIRGAGSTLVAGELVGSLRRSGVLSG